MRTGEWTQGMSLVVAAAVEAMAMKDETDPIKILERIRSFRPDPTQEVGDFLDNWHEVTWLLTFSSANIFDVNVKVSLLCKDCPGYTHNWVSRKVTICEKNETRPGEYWHTYEGQLGQPLERTEFDHWTAD